jgi:hypothetical protein
MNTLTVQPYDSKVVKPTNVRDGGRSISLVYVTVPYGGTIGIKCICM